MPLNVTRMATCVGSMSVSAVCGSGRPWQGRRCLYIQAGRREGGSRPRSSYIKSTRGKRKTKAPFTCKLFHTFYPTIGIAPSSMLFFVFMNRHCPILDAILCLHDTFTIAQARCYLDDLFVLSNAQSFHFWHLPSLSLSHLLSSTTSNVHC